MINSAYDPEDTGFGKFQWLVFEPVEQLKGNMRKGYRHKRFVYMDAKPKIGEQYLVFIGKDGDSSDVTETSLCDGFSLQRLVSADVQMKMARELAKKAKP